MIDDITKFIASPSEEMKKLPDDKGEWMAGAARITKISLKDGTDVAQCAYSEVGKIRALTTSDCMGNREILPRWRNGRRTSFRS